MIIYNSVFFFFSFGRKYSYSFDCFNLLFRNTNEREKSRLRKIMIRYLSTTTRSYKQIFVHQIEFLFVYYKKIDVFVFLFAFFFVFIIWNFVDWWSCYVSGWIWITRKHTWNAINSMNWTNEIWTFNHGQWKFLYQKLSPCYNFSIVIE